MVRDQTGWMLDILGDPERTGVVIVSAPEEMPVQETIELAERLGTDTVVDLAAHMRALYRAGRQHEALESYDGYRTLLADELGGHPNTVRLHLQRLVADGWVLEETRPAAGRGRPA